MNKQTLWIVLMFVAMMLWGLSWPCSKLLSFKASAYVLSFLRLVLVCASFVPVMVYLKIPFKLSLNDIKLLAIAGAFNSLYSLLFFVGLTYGFAGKAGVITVTLSPIFATLLAALIYKQVIPTKEKLGLVLGLIAGGFLLEATSLDSLLSPFNAFFIGAAISWAALTLISRHILQSLNPIALNFYTSLFSLIYFLPVIFVGDFSVVLNAESSFFVELAIVAMLSTAIGTSIFYQGVAVLGISKGASFMLLVPLCALFFSFVALDEVPDSYTLIGGSLAVLAIYCISLYKPSHIKFLKKIFKGSV